MPFKIYECSCEKCSQMCHAPCCGTPEDMKKLIDNGYAKRLMYDDLPGGNNMLKPALKGYEGEKAPWSTSSRFGCTFWKDGKCELHSLGLKPSQGRFAVHNMPDEDQQKIAEYINDSWSSRKGDKVVKEWKKINIKK